MTQPSTPATASTGPLDPQAGAPRTFASLHRDVWRTALRAPMLLLVLPVVLWLPVDYVAETVMMAAGDGIDGFVAGMQVQNAAQIVIGLWLMGAQLIGLRNLATTGEVRTLDAMKRGFTLVPGLFALNLVVGLTVLFCLALFIVPGLWALSRFALVFPVLAFEDRPVMQALTRSSSLMQGKKLWLVGVSIGWLALYLFPVASPTLLLPEVYSPLAGALATMPMNLVLNLALIALVIVYADARPTDAAPFLAPVGPPDARDEVIGRPLGSGRSAILILIIASVVVVVGSVVYWLFFAPVAITGL